MAHDQVVTAKHVLAAQARFIRFSPDPLADLETREPDLAEYLLERLGEIYRRLDQLSVPQRRVHRLQRYLERTILVCLEAQRQAYRQLLEPASPESSDQPPLLTPQRVAAYIADQAAHCPFCAGTEIRTTGEPIVPHGATLASTVRCETCKATWREHFTLTGADLKTPPQPTSDGSAL